MSIGNLKDSGNQGNNFPWQLKMLQGLQQISDSLASTFTNGPRIPNVERHSGPFVSGNDFFSFSIANVGSADGIAMGETIKPGEVVNFDAGTLNNYFPAGDVSADGTGTELLITYITA